MKITVSNILEQYPKLNIELPKALNQDEFEDLKDSLDLYSEDETIKKYINTFVSKLNEIINKEGKPEKPKDTRIQKTKSTEKPQRKKTTRSGTKKTTVKKAGTRKKGSTQKSKAKATQREIPVEHFTPEERFMKRYLLLDGKVKTKGQILNFIKSLQKAITERKIKKGSKHAEIIGEIQKELVKVYNNTPDSVEGIKITIDPKKVDSLKQEVGVLKVRLSVTYIKRFIGLYGKETKEKVKHLQSLINKAIESKKIKSGDPYFKQLQSVLKALTNYLNSDDITVSETVLRGLSGIAGQKTPVASLGNPFKNTDVVSSLDLQRAVFRHMGFTGIWKKIIGDPEEPFHVMIYGPGGKGKSTFGVKFAAYLSKDLQRKVLYVADEEKISDKLKGKLQQYNAYNQNLSVTGKMPKSLKGHEVVFVDSVTSMGMEPETLEAMQEQYPGISFIYILQTNKQGSFYGRKRWEHLCDVVLRFEDGVVNVEKNRFGKLGEYRG